MNNIIDIDVIIDEEYIDPKVTIETNAKNTYVESIVDAIENVAVL